MKLKSILKMFRKGEKRLNILEEIILYKKEVELKNFSSNYIKELEKKIENREKPIKDFKTALKEDGINIIAEVKKASPSKGIIRKDFDPVDIAKTYEKGGAKAISVLTDKKYFQGDLSYLELISKNVNLPLLRKDFIIDERQVLEAVAFGGDSYLLIAKVLDEKQLHHLINFGRQFGLEPLVEIHNEYEAEKSIQAGAKIVGINNRDLETFQVDINLSKQLSPKLKEMGAEITVAESGLNKKEQLLELKKYLVDAFLIGEALTREKDIQKKLKELID